MEVIHIGFNAEAHFLPVPLGVCQKAVLRLGLAPDVDIRGGIGGRDIFRLYPAGNHIYLFRFQLDLLAQKGISRVCQRDFGAGRAVLPLHLLDHGPIGIKIPIFRPSVFPDIQRRVVYKNLPRRGGRSQKAKRQTEY